MNYHYQIKKATELSGEEIKTILSHWAVEEWREIEPDVFIAKFRGSEFHVLYSEQGELLSVARMNFEFKIIFNDLPYSFAELVGLVSIVKEKGFARYLLKEIQQDFYFRNIPAIGFCSFDLREFYRKCGIESMPGKAKMLLEKSDHGFIVSEDDDILLINISGEYRKLLNGLSFDKPGYLDLTPK